MLEITNKIFEEQYRTFNSFNKPIHVRLMSFLVGQLKGIYTTEKSLLNTLIDL
jgi:hypothetical protein